MVPLSLEVGLRRFGYAQLMEFVPDARFGYLMRPSRETWAYGHPVAINDHGLRGPSFVVPKASGVVRFVFAGDSVTYGGGRLRERELFCRIVEARAAEDGHLVESVNVAAPGWSPQNWWAYFQDRGLMDADALVMVLPTIDLDRPFATMERHGLREHSPMLRLSVFLARFESLYWRRPGVSADERREAVKRNLSVIAAVRGRAGGRLLAVLLPSRPGMTSRSLWALFEPLVPGALDLREALGRDDFMDEIHLNARGHRKVGQRISDRLRVWVKDPTRQE